MKRKALAKVGKLAEIELDEAYCDFRMDSETHGYCDAPACFYARVGCGWFYLCRRHLAMLVRQAQKALGE